MISKYGLNERTVARIGEVLARFPEVDRAIIFGSRAKGTYKPGSDVDLALAGDGLGWQKLGQIDNALDDLLLPYRFSLVHYGDKLDSEVAAHIQRVGALFYEKSPATILQS